MAATAVEIATSCVDCGARFSITVDHAAALRAHAFPPLRRCEACRNRRRSARNQVRLALYDQPAQSRLGRSFDRDPDQHVAGCALCGRLTETPSTDSLGDRMVYCRACRQALLGRPTGR